MSNRTFAIIKPDAVKNKYTGLIYDRILKADFNILSSKLIKMTRKQAENVIRILKGKAPHGLANPEVIKNIFLMKEKGNNRWNGVNLFDTSLNI